MSAKECGLDRCRRSTYQQRQIAEHLNLPARISLEPFSQCGPWSRYRKRRNQIPPIRKPSQGRGFLWKDGDVPKMSHSELERLLGSEPRSVPEGFRLWKRQGLNFPAQTTQW